MKKDKVITTFIVLLILLIAFIVISNKGGETSEDVAKCIGEKSILYVQNGCPHCRTQEEMFGENLKYLNIIICNENWEACQNILGTPSWEINGKLIESVQSIEKLQELTGC